MGLSVSYLLQVGANKSNLVTKTSSLGMWVPVHDEEWDGDVPLGLDRPDLPQTDSESGIVTFKGNTLPWLAGRYEVRCLYILKWSSVHHHTIFRFAITTMGNTMS
jgi:hypothetical protein